MKKAELFFFRPLQFMLEITEINHMNDFEHQRKFDNMTLVIKDNLTCYPIELGGLGNGSFDKDCAP